LRGDRGPESALSRATERVAGAYPDEILRRGPTDQKSLAWLARHWSTRDELRKIVARPNPSTGRRLPSGHAVVSHRFFTSGETPRAAVTQLGARWPALRFVLTPRPAG
jgi:hypothetical protein